MLFQKPSMFFATLSSPARCSSTVSNVLMGILLFSYGDEGASRLMPCGTTRGETMIAYTPPNGPLPAHGLNKQDHEIGFASIMYGVSCAAIFNCSLVNHHAILGLRPDTSE